VPGGGGYTDPDMDTDQHPDPYLHPPEPVIYTVTDPQPVPDEPDDEPSPYPTDLHRVHAYHGDCLVLDGYASTDFIDALADLDPGLAVAYGEPDPEIVAPPPAGRRRVLPVRPQPFTDHYTAPNAVTYRDPPGVTTYVGDPPIFDVRSSHEHRHAHADPDDAFRVAYWHDHPHTHPGGYRHPSTRHVADVALHDHAHG
jgi:hypothetical protein